MSGAVISGRYVEFTFSLFFVDLYSKENHEALKNAIPSSSRTVLRGHTIRAFEADKNSLNPCLNGSLENQTDHPPASLN